MNSNKFFSFSRFYLLLRNDILLNRQKYLLTIAGAFIFGFVFLYMQMPKVERLDNQIPAFNGSRYVSVFALFLIGLGWFIATSFSELGDKVKTSNYLLMPASTFEKFLSQFVIRVVIGTSLLLVIFWADAHLARTVALSQIEGPNHEPASANVSKYIAEFHYSMFLVKHTNNNEPTYWRLAEGMALISFIFSIGMYLFSKKLFHKKNGFGKSRIISIVIIFSILFLMPDSNWFSEFNSFISNNIERQLQNGYTNIDIWRFSIAYFAPLFLIPFGYFKLKEKQL
jgi:hypothetical protein